MRRVLGCRRAERDHIVVARTLALGAQPTLRDPGKGGNLRGANQSGRELRERVTARNVSEPRGADDLPVCLRPLERVFRQKNTGTRTPSGVLIAELVRRITALVTHA
jgi:hypothetical protein